MKESYLFIYFVPISTAIAGLAVTFGLNLNMLQASLISKLCNLENRIISVERILQYMCIPSEPPLVIEASRPNCSWPSQGEVDIHGLQVWLHVLYDYISCSFVISMIMVLA